MKKFTLALMAMLAFSFSLKAQMYVSTTPAHRNVILEEFTGRNCQYCPDGHAIANKYRLIIRAVFELSMSIQAAMLRRRTPISTPPTARQ